jgi:hypothetical protein
MLLLRTVDLGLVRPDFLSPHGTPKQEEVVR